MKLLDRMGITGWEERDRRREEMSYLDYLRGEAYLRGAYYTPGNGYDTSKRWRGWLNILLRLLPHIRMGKHEGEPYFHFTLTQIPMRRYEDEAWAIGFCGDKYPADRLGEGGWEWSWLRGPY